MSVVVEKNDITRIKCDAIVNPANSMGFMGGGVAGAIKHVGGIEIEKEAVSKAPIDVGKAVATTAGSLSCKHVIHAPTMSKPAMKIDIGNVRSATLAAFKLAEKLHLKSIALPGMGTGVGGVPRDNAAETIVTIAKTFEDSFKTIYLIDRDEEMVKYFKMYI